MNVWIPKPKFYNSTADDSFRFDGGGKTKCEPKHMLYSVGQDVSLHRTEWKRKIYAIDLAQRVDSISRKSMKIPLNK